MANSTWRTATYAAASLCVAASAAQAQAVNYGAGCPGESGTTPTIGVTGYPVTGTSFTIDVTGPASGSGFFILGFFNGAPFPLDLTPSGLPGCALYQTTQVTFPIAFDGAGDFGMTVGSTWAAGLSAFAQVYSLDFGGTTLGGMSDGLSITSQAPSGFVGGELIVTEFMKDPSFAGDNDGEWFELYNTTGSAIDIKRWIVEDNDFDGTVLDNGGSGISVPAGGYVVVGNNGDTAVNGGITMDGVYGLTGQLFLSNSADEIVLRDTTGVEIDRIEYDNGVVWAEAPGRSLALDAGSLTGVLNDLGTNWALSTCTIAGSPCNPDTGTPGTANDTCSTVACPSGGGELIITEIMQNPAAVGDNDGEWFEVYNTTGSAIDMLGYTIKAGGSPSSDVITSSVVVPAGGFALFARLTHDFFVIRLQVLHVLARFFRSFNC